MDDVDAAHAQAAQHMAETGDLITSKINGIRYIEKPPLPYWMVAGTYKIFGQNTFATHLPNTLAMLGLTWLAWLWARRAWGPRAGLYAGLAVLTSVGPFLFTRFIIPEAELSLFLLSPSTPSSPASKTIAPIAFTGSRPASPWRLLTKGLIAPVFFIGAAVPYLLLTGQWRRWRVLKPVSGLLLFLLIAAPWHILCGIANPDQGHPIGNHPTLGNVHGFFYFYFINEHFLRFFGLRYPHDYNKLPFSRIGCCTWCGSSPGACFCPPLVAWPGRPAATGCSTCTATPAKPSTSTSTTPSAKTSPATSPASSSASAPSGCSRSSPPGHCSSSPSPRTRSTTPSPSGRRSSSSSPASWPALRRSARPTALRRQQARLLSTAWLTGAQAAFAVIGVLSAIALGWGLWASRNLPFVPDIGTLLAHRGVGDYTLSMSHLFDLTGPSFAALRLPAVLAAIALLIGPALGWLLRLKKKHLAATISVALTFTVFLIAAHIAFARFEPMLSSKPHGRHHHRQRRAH